MPWSLTYLLYGLVWSLVFPLLAVVLACRPRYRPLMNRFAPRVPPFVDRPVWIHACSVGEVTTAKPILESLNRRWPDLPICLTVSTRTGMELANTLAADCALTWFPFDQPGVVRRFIHELRPRLLVLVETELWPTVLHEMAQTDIPVALVNGRISDKHFPRYKRMESFLRPFLKNIGVAAMQDDEYARRLTELGAEHVHVAGNTKFDGVEMEVERDKQGALRAALGISEDETVIVFGSTRPGDEKLAASCWQGLHDAFPLLRLVIAPRHLERVDEAIACFDEPILMRSKSEIDKVDSRVSLLDTHGELRIAYSLATVAVIGGSFFPGVEGHNPLESAALGVPTVFGPYMANFRDPAERLVASGGAVQVESDAALLNTLRELLNDHARCEAIGARGREIVIENQGAIERNLDLLAPYLDKS